MYVYVCMYVFMCICTREYTCICMCYMCVCMCVYVYMYMGGQYLYRCIRTHGYVCRRKKYRTPRDRLKENACVDPPSPPRRPLSSSEGEEGRSCLMATECWMGLLMGQDGRSTLWEGSWVSPNVMVGTLAQKTTEGETKVGNIEYICM